MSNSKVRKPNVVRGGTAIPLGRNYYYMSGRKHETGGIDIGKNPRTGIEVEDGEVMHVGQNEIKVFSAQPFLNGKSPAQRVMHGDNPNAVFNAQERFKKRNKLNDDGTKKKRMGGLSRNKDYGSKSKPYPSVKSGDFAGGHRSYPIPTKADAVDALRLAGLHGRNDVKAKVYRKYPELRKKSKAGGLYSVTSNGKTKLYQFPSTGESSARSAEVRIRKVGGGPKGMNPDLYDEEDDYKYNYSLSPAVNEQLRQEHEEIKSRTTIGQNPNPTNAPASSSNNSENKEDNKDNWWRRTTNKIGEYIKDNPSIIPDAIGLTSNTVGGLLSHKWNRDMLNKLKYSDQPIARSATKLKTRININPQLDKMRETLAAYERDIDNNTASSRVALARKQRARLANMLATNELYGNKENIETELINKDKLNQQSVAHANIADYNKWAEGRAAFRNAVLEKKAENDVALAETLNAGVQDLIGRREKRKSENQTITAMALANPDLPIEVFYEQGLINKKTYEAYKKAYRNKKKND